MINLLIVDDEPLHRQGIMNVLRKLRPEYEIYEAINGEEAIEVVNREQIDVILTDIRMPVMDGFEFLHAIDPELRNIKVIVITAYRDFDYAKQALKFRAFDYIVKPVDIDDLEVTIGRVEERIGEERRRSYNQDLLTRMLNQSQRIYLEHQLVKAYSSGLNDEEANQVNDFFPLHKPGILVCADVSNWGRFEDKDELYTQFIDQWRQWGDILPFTLKPQSDEIVLIIQRSTEGMETDGIARLASELEIWNDALGEMTMCRLSLGLSYPCGSLQDEWRIAYEQARRSCDKAFYSGLGKVYLPSAVCTDERDLPIDFYIGSLKESLLRKDLQGIKHIMVDLLQCLPQGNVSPAKVKKAYKEMLTKQLEWMEADVDLQSILEAITNSQTMTELHAFAMHIMTEWVHRLEKKSTFKMEQIMLACREYVNEHYMEDITLDSLAEQYHFNPSYFSQQFKRFTGMKLSDYIIDVRLEQGKKLLTTTNEKIYQIAALVGYSNDKYFIRLFKKRVGMTPDQYRNLFFTKQFHSHRRQS